MHNLMIASLLAITVISASSCVKPISNHKPATHSPFEGGWRLTTSCGTSHYIGITLTQQGDGVYGTWVDDTNTIRSSGKIKGVIKSGTLRMESCSNDIESELAYNYCPQLVSDYFSIEMGNLVWYHSSGYRYAVLQKNVVDPNDMTYPFLCPDHKKSRGRAYFVLHVVFVMSLSPLSSATRLQQKILLPTEIQGTWKFGADRCLISETSDSDGVMAIYRNYIHSNEEIIFPRSISLISNNPSAWRIVGISNIAPVDVQGQADIYVLKNKTLTVTDGKTVRQYVKCD